MATHNTSSNQPSPEHHGDPAARGQPKGAGDKPLGADLEQPELADQYTEDGADEAIAPLLQNPNRNTDKPEVDKPAYGGGH